MVGGIWLILEDHSFLERGSRNLPFHVEILHRNRMSVMNFHLIDRIVG